MYNLTDWSGSIHFLLQIHFDTAFFTGLNMIQFIQYIVTNGKIFASS